MLRLGPLARPTSAGTFTAERACAGSPQSHLGYDYMDFGLIQNRTFTSRLGSLMGCTQSGRQTKGEGTSGRPSPLPSPRSFLARRGRRLALLACLIHDGA